MHVNNISNHVGLDSGFVGSTDQTVLQVSVRGVSDSGASLLNAISVSPKEVPSLDLHQWMKNVFAVLKSNAINQPSSSNDKRLKAWNTLESRQFEPAPGAQLKVPLTANGLLGGTLPEEQQRIVEAQQMRVNDLTERFNMFSRTLVAQSTLLQQYTARGDVQSIREVNAMLQTTQTSLSDVNHKLRFAQAELERVQARQAPHPLAATHGIAYQSFR